MKKNKMETMPMPKLVLNMSLPLMFSLLIQSLYNIVDSIFVAKLGEEALTAATLAFPAQMLMIAVGVGTSVGVNAVLSRNLGAKNFDDVKNTAVSGVILALASTLVFMLLGAVGIKPFVNAFTDNEKIAGYSRDYLSVIMLVCIGSFTATMFQRFLQSVGDTFGSMLSLAAGAVTNLILDPIMIFGYFGMPRMEVRGAAIATVIGQCISAVTAILLNHFKNPAVKVNFKGYKPRKEIFYGIYKVGFPTIVTQAVGSVMMASMNAILMPFSASSVAFFGVYFRLQSFLFMPMNGLGQAAIPIVGYCYGAKNYKRIKEAAKIILPAAMLIALVFTCVFNSIPNLLLGLFSPSEEMLKTGIPALRIISITFVMTSVTMILGYIVSGLGNGFVNMFGTLLRQLVILIPLAYIFADSFGIDMVWYAFWISEGIAMIFAIIAAGKIVKRLISTNIP